MYEVVYFDREEGEAAPKEFMSGTFSEFSFVLIGTKSHEYYFDEVSSPI